jgi:hypothetical protein
MRLIASLLQMPDVLPEVLQYLSTTSDIKPPTLAASLLGLAVDVALRLRPRKGQASTHGKELVLAQKDNILKYYRDNILASRTPLHPHILVRRSQLTRRGLDLTICFDTDRA